MKNIFRIIQISKPLHKYVYAITILVFVSALLELVTPILSKFIIDEITLKISGQGGDLQIIITLIAIGFAVDFFNTGLQSVRDRMGDFFAGRLRRFLTNKFYAKILSLPQSYFDSEISGKISSQLNRGILTIQDFFNTGSNFFFPMMLQSIFTIAVLAYYDLLIAFLVFLLFPIYLFLTYLSTKKWGEHEKEKNMYEDRVGGRIQEVLTNIKVVKTFTNESKEHEFISDNLEKRNEVYDRQSSTFHKIDFARNISLQIVLLIVSAIVFYEAFQGTMTIGVMVLVIQLVNQARRPLFAMSFILTRIQAAESGSKEYFEIMELESKEPYELKEEVKRISNPELEFTEIDFSYDDGNQVLSDISFKIASSEKIALVGHSGAGKSTIINLILKLYTPSNGKIILNGSDYENLSHQYVRGNIGLVMQDNELFSTTIRDNVSYGMNATDNEIIEALKAANAYDFVMKLPKKLDSEVGERGVRLSGGQKQRIQIARAVLKNAPILILDEATSNLDSISEKAVQDALENLMQNRMVIIIAHRFSTIQNVDRVFVIDEGKIVDRGTPQELAKKKESIYSQLLRYQVEGNKKLLEKFELY